MRPEHCQRSQPARIPDAIRQRPGRAGRLLAARRSRPRRSPRDPLAPKTAAPSAHGQVRHLAVHGRRPQPRRPVRPQAGAANGWPASRCPPPSAKSITAMGTGDNTLMPSKRTWKQYGQSGIWVSDWYPEHRAARRRHHGDPLLLGRRPEPRRLGLPDEHRLDPRRPPLAGRVGHLRPGHPRTRTCRPSSSCPTPRKSSGGPQELELRLPARHLSGHAVPPRRRRRSSI